MLDLANRKMLASFDVAKGPDALAFDPTLGWLYVAGESGQVLVLKVEGQTVSVLGTAKLGPDSHVVAVDSTTHEAFFPLKPAHGKRLLRITKPNAGIRHACDCSGTKIGPTKVGGGRTPPFQRNPGIRAPRGHTRPEGGIGCVGVSVRGSMVAYDRSPRTPQAKAWATVAAIDVVAWPINLDSS